MKLVKVVNVHYGVQDRIAIIRHFNELQSHNGPNQGISNTKSRPQNDRPSGFLPKIRKRNLITKN